MPEGPATPLGSLSKEEEREEEEEEGNSCVWDPNGLQPGSGPSDGRQQGK